MKQTVAKKHRPLMVKKFDTMLLGGTLTMMVVSILLMSDSVIAGIFIGSDAAAGINLVTPIYSLSAFFGSVFSLGVPIRYSLKMGQFEKKEADRVFGTGLLMSVSVGIILFILASVFGDAFIRGCHPSAQALEQARSYLFWMRFTVLFLPLDMLMAEMVYNDGDDRISVIANCVQGIGNLSFSLILSRVMGIGGIGLASFLFTFLSLATLFIHFFSKSNSLKLYFYFSPKVLFSIVRYSVIDASTYLWLGAGNAMLNWFVCTHFGTDYLILVSVITLCREFQLVFDGIGEAITPIISVYLGEDCFPGVRTIYSRARRTAVFEGLVLILVMYVAAPLVPALLGIKNVKIMKLAIAGLRIVSLGSVFTSLLYLSTSYYLLLDRISLGLGVSAMRDVVVSVPAALIFGLAFGIHGLFAGFALASFIAWLFSSLFLRIRYGSDAPLLLKRRESGKEALLYSLDVETSSVLATRDRLGEALEERGFDEKTVVRTQLVFEELFMLIYEKNPGRSIQAECAVLIEGGRIRMISRDTGCKVDLSDPDMEIDSLRSYVISSVTNQISSQKHHLVTMSFNRNMIELEGNRAAKA
ncbi:MAG: multidrug transporter MatE [Clostridia bacterium]|nr:multidrug transporter MatE [Clostridia bacterium]